jgi:hypothetical protein
MTGYRPIAENADSVTLRRADYDAILAALEDATDLAAIRDVSARVAAGEDEYVPTAVIERLAAGEHPVRVWREHRGMTGRALAAAAHVPASYLCRGASARDGGSEALAAGIGPQSRR